MYKGCWTTVNAIANEIGILHDSSFLILTKRLGLSKLSVGWVPKALVEDQMTQRADHFVALVQNWGKWSKFFKIMCHWRWDLDLPV